MSLLLEGDSLEVKAIKLHLTAAKHKVSIAKEHAEWSNYQLDESKKHLKDVQKKLREAKRGVDILDNAAADEDSKQEASNSSGPKRIRLQRGVCVIAHGAKRKLCSHPGCTNWAIRFASACSMHGPGGRKNTQTAGELLIKNTDKSSSAGEKRDNKQEVLQQPPVVKKRKTTDILEGGKKAKKLSKLEYDKARREAMKAGTWKPDPSKQPKRMRNGAHNTLDSGSTEEINDNKQGVLQQPPEKKRKTTHTSEGATKTKQLSKSAYDKARRAAMKAGTWKPDPRYQPKSKRPKSKYQLPSNPTTMSSGNTGSSGIEMLTKAAESDLLHSLFKSNSRVAENDNDMDEGDTAATQLDDISRRSGRKRTPSSKKREATTKNTPIKKPPQKGLIRPNTQVVADDNNIGDTNTEVTQTINTVSSPSDVRRINDAIHAVNMAWSGKKRQIDKKRQWGAG